MPTVSIVTATWNCGHYLPLAIESVLAQTFADWELLIIDDGSTDNTEDIVQPYLNDSRITYHRLEHAGQPATKNAGIERASGELIAFLDADDVWFPHKLKRQVELMRSNPALGVVYSRRQLIDPEGNELETPCPSLHRGQVVSPMFIDNFVCFSSSMVRRSVFEAVGTFDESIPMAIDYDLWLRVATRYPFDFVDEPLVYYRTGHSNLSRRAGERLEIALGIMNRFVAVSEQRSKLSQRTIRRAYSETYAHLAEHAVVNSKWRAAQWLARAITCSPFCWEPWRIMTSWATPRWSRKLVKRMLGMPTSQSQRRIAGTQLISSADSAVPPG